MGQAGTLWAATLEPSISTSARCLDAILTWIKKSWCPMCCVDLAGGGHHRNTGRPVSDSGQIVSSHGHGGAYWNFLGLLCTTHDEMMRDPSGVTKFQEPERQSTDGGERGGKVFGLY